MTIAIIKRFYNLNSGHGLMSKKQQQWLDMQKFIKKMRIPIVLTKPRGRLRAKVFGYINNKYYDMLDMLMVMITLCIIASKDHDNPLEEKARISLIILLLNCYF